MLPSYAIDIKDGEFLTPSATVNADEDPLWHLSMQPLEGIRRLAAKWCLRVARGIFWGARVRRSFWPERAGCVGRTQESKAGKQSLD
jgi:hypothetical protein